MHELWEIENLGPKYKKDYRIAPEAPFSAGVDCSRYIFLAAKRAGIPGVARVCAADMRRGLGGWRGRDLVGLRDAEECDLGFLGTDRITHVFTFVVGKRSRLLEVIHAAKRSGTVVVQPFPEKWHKRINSIRRLTIGD